MAVRTTIRVLPHMANSSRIFSAARRPRLRYTRLSGRSSLRPSQGRYLVRLELVASAVLLGVAALWGAVRGLDLAAAVRPSLAALAVGAACGLGLARDGPLAEPRRARGAGPGALLGDLRGGALPRRPPARGGHRRGERDLRPPPPARHRLRAVGRRRGRRPGRALRRDGEPRGTRGRARHVQPA